MMLQLSKPKRALSITLAGAKRSDFFDGMTRIYATQRRESHWKRAAPKNSNARAQGDKVEFIPSGEGGLFRRSVDQWTSNYLRSCPDAGASRDRVLRW